MRRLVLLAFAVIGVLTMSGVRASDWQPYGLQGLTVRSLAAAPDLLCAGTQSFGVFCRDFSAPDDRWRSLGLVETPITWLWIDPARPHLIFAAIGESYAHPVRLYRTLDGGTTWEPADGDLTHAPYAVHGVPDSPTVFGAGWGVWRSDDLGDSWSHLSLHGGLWSLEVAPTDRDTVWAGGETVAYTGFTILSRDGGLSWDEVWNSRLIGDNQTADIAAHPHIDGLVLTGHEGFTLRTLDHGETFDETLTAPARFFLDWDRDNPRRAYAAGSPNDAGGLAFVSRDRGMTWSEYSGGLGPRLVYRLAADGRRLGVAYAATDDGVYRFYGGGLPLCLDTEAGIDQLRLFPGPCLPGGTPGDTTIGDAIVGHLGQTAITPTHVDLGEVECVIDDGDVSLTGIDPPEPAPGRALFILVRLDGEIGYGLAGNGLPRLPAKGDCSRY